MYSQFHTLGDFVTNNNQIGIRPQHVPVSTANSLKIVGTTVGNSVRSKKQIIGRILI